MKKVNNNYLVIILFIVNNLIYSQEEENNFLEESDWGIYSEYLQLKSKSLYEINGVNAAAIYYLGDSFGIHVGSGYEHLNYLDMHYYPLYLGLNLQFRRINSIYTRVSFGKHLGEFDKAGFLFRWGFGYQYNLFKKTQAYLGFLYCYQNIYKTTDLFDKSTFNIEGVGFSLGLKFN